MHPRIAFVKQEPSRETVPVIRGCHARELAARIAALLYAAASKIARQHIATSCNICIVSWRCGSTELIMLRVGE